MTLTELGLIKIDCTLNFMDIVGRRNKFKK